MAHRCLRAACWSLALGSQVRETSSFQEDWKVGAESFGARSVAARPAAPGGEERPRVHVAVGSRGAAQRSLTQGLEAAVASEAAGLLEASAAPGEPGALSPGPGWRVGLLGALAAGLCAVPWGYRHANTEETSVLLLQTYTLSILTNSLFAIVMPDSLSLVAKLGGDAATSGLSISMHKVGNGSMAAFIFLLGPQTVLTHYRALLVGSAVLCVAGAVLYSIAVQGGSLAALFVAGLLRGLVDGAGSQILRAALTNLLAPAQQTRAFAMFMTCVVTGIGLGPALSSLAHVLLEPEVGEHAVGYVMIALACAVVSCTASIRFPAALEGDRLTATLAVTAEKAPNVPVIVGAVGSNLLRGLLISGLEAASIMMLEIKPHDWSSRDAGFYTALCFLTIVPVMLLVKQVTASDKVVIRALLFVSLVGAGFLVTGAGTGHSDAALEWRVASLFVADVLLFPTLSVAGGMANGLSMQACGGAWTHSRVLFLTAMAVDMVGRGGGPAVARAIVQSGGRSAYAGLQLGILGLIGIVLEVLVFARLKDHADTAEEESAERAALQAENQKLRQTVARVHAG